MTSFSLNIDNFITLRLTPTNYPMREQALALVDSQDLVGHLTNDDSAPTQYTTSNSNGTTNRKFYNWVIGTLSKEALGLVVGLDTTHTTQEHEFTLRQQIMYLRKEDGQSIGEHIRTFKGLCDNLVAIGKLYETFTTTMLKPPRPSYFELISQLQSHDQRRNWFSNHSNVHNSSAPQVAFYGKPQRSRQFSSQHQGNSQTFTSIEKGFQAQHPRNQNKIQTLISTQQRRPPPPGQRHMTPAE
ncbi:hypothetical protein JHK87_001664 [Glycine soja]|nr:hypothetical protein JHK87_001664 [Glycine soja]